MSPDPSLGGAAPHEDSGDQDDQCDRAGGGRRQCPSLQARPRHGGVAGTDAASDDDRRQAAAARHAAALPWQAGRSRTDKAFDSNAIIADLNERGAKIVISQHPRRAVTLPLDEEMYMASFDRELLLQTQGVQTHRHARRKNRPEFRSHHPSRRRHDKLPMNLNRP